MRKKKAKKELEKAEKKLQNAQEKQDKAEARAKAKGTALKPAQAEKLDAAVKAEEKNVEEAERVLARAQGKRAPAEKEPDAPAVSPDVDISGLDAKEAGGAIQAALSGSVAVTVTGEAQASGETISLEIPPGASVLWGASYAADTPEAALSIRTTADAGKDDDEAPVFCVSEDGLVSNAGKGGSAMQCSGVRITVDGGTVRSTHGDGIISDGEVEVLSGVVAAAGTESAPATTIQAKRVKLKGGFVLGRAPKKSDAGGGTLAKAAVIRGAADDLKDGAACACVWVTEDGKMPAEDGSETGLVYWPEEACVWWDVAPDGATSIYAGRKDQSNSVAIGEQTLPAPPDMQEAGNKIVAMPIVFTAKTETAERPVLLDIAWGWDLFLTQKGAEQYDNRLAVAACALANSVYEEDDITALLERLGFSRPVFKNYGELNATSAFVLAHAQIEDSRTPKTVFAVINRGSKTIWDWKGNIVDETVQNAQFFGQSANAVAEGLKDYAGKYGQKKPQDNIFFVVGHSLGAVVTDLLAAKYFGEYPARNVFAYTFAAPLADPAAETDDSRPIYNILNENDMVTSFPPRPGYKRVGTDNYTFSSKGKNARAMARAFRFLSHTDIDKVSGSGTKNLFNKMGAAMLWNHSLTTYMAYLLSGGPDRVKSSGGLFAFVQNVITAVGSSDS